MSASSEWVVIPIDPGSNPGRLVDISSEFCVGSFEKTLGELGQGRLERVPKGIPNPR